MTSDNVAAFSGPKVTEINSYDYSTVKLDALVHSIFLTKQLLSKIDQQKQ